MTASLQALGTIAHEEFAQDAQCLCGRFSRRLGRENDATNDDAFQFPGDQVSLGSIERKAENTGGAFLYCEQSAHIDFWNGKRLYHRSLAARRMHRSHGASRPGSCLFYSPEELWNHAVESHARANVRYSPFVGNIFVTGTINSLVEKFVTSIQCVNAIVQGLKSLSSPDQSPGNHSVRGVASCARVYRPVAA